jgi:hypothetical protein
LIDSHIKVKTCYTKLLEKNDSPQLVREQFADYLGTKGMVNSALDYYHEALSLNADKDTHIRINRKMAGLLQSDKSSDYATRAKNIESSHIVYSIADIEYNNPFIAVLPNLKAKHSNLNTLLTMTDSMVRNGQRALVQHLINTYQDEELFTQIQDHYTSSAVQYHGQTLYSYQRSINNNCNEDVITSAPELRFNI